MIYSPSGASAGIGFAIPVNTVATIVPQLLKHGRLVRPILGIDAAPQSWLARNNLQGVPVLRTARGLPAERAGVQGVKRDRWGAWVLGDIIIGIDDKAINNYDDLLATLEAYKAGQIVTLHINRDGKKLSAQLKLAAPQ
jgi:S1-C subfamily serine protease